MQIPRIIEENPFRILGVCSNASKREIIANKNKMLAFARLNKSVSFPMDMNVFMPTPERSQEDLRKAEADINLPKDKIKFALFWFINLTESDKQALDQLSKGSVGPAENIWRSHRGVSAYINLACLSLLQNNVTDFLRFTNLALSKEEECFTLLQAIGCGSEQIEISQLTDAILNELHSNVEEDVLIEAVEELEDETFLEKLNTLLTKSILPLIERELRVSREVKLNDADRAYEEGQRLFKATWKDAKRIKNLTNGKIVSVNLILDQLSERVKDCVLAYFRETSDLSPLEKISYLMEFAQSIAISSEQQNKVKNAFNKIQVEAKVLPYLNELRKENNAFEFSTQDFQGITSYLDSVIPIITMLGHICGHDSELVKGNATMVTRKVLNIVIDTLNNSVPKAQDDLTLAIEVGSRRALLDEAQKIISRLELLNMSDDCRSWLDRNKKLIKKEASEVYKLSTSISLENQRDSDSLLGSVFGGIWSLIKGIYYLISFAIYLGGFIFILFILSQVVFK